MWAVIITTYFGVCVLWKWTLMELGGIDSPYCDYANPIKYSSPFILRIPRHPYGEGWNLSPCQAGGIGSLFAGQSSLKPVVLWIVIIFFFIPMKHVLWVTQKVRVVVCLFGAVPGNEACTQRPPESLGWVLLFPIYIWVPPPPPLPNASTFFFFLKPLQLIIWSCPLCRMFSVCSCPSGFPSQCRTLWLVYLK